MGETLRISVITSSRELAERTMPMADNSLFFGAIPFDIHKHGRRLHEWCNKAYSARFWDMQGSFEELMTYFQERENQQNITCMLITVNDEPVAFAECYPIIGSELEEHIPEAGPTDYGFHFLMAPPRDLTQKFPLDKKLIPRWAVMTLLGFCFTNRNVENMYGEPDMENEKALKLADRIGFEQLKEIQLSDKKAVLIRYKKEKYPKF